MDFSVAERATLLQCIVCTLFFLCVVFKNYNFTVKKIDEYRVSSRQINWFIISFILLSVFYMVDTDFFHYQTLVLKKFDLEEQRWNHMEAVYGIIISFFNRNYFMFRLIVWGGASFLTYLTCKRFLGNGYYAMFFLFCSYFGLFSYSRSSLGMALFFLGLSFLIIEDHKLYIRFLLGIPILLTSYCFHHSMALLIALVPIVIVPINKFIVLVSVFFVPAILTFMTQIFDMITVSDIFIEDSQEGGISGRIESITSPDNKYTVFGGMSILMIIRVFYGYMTLFVPFICITKKIIFEYRTSIIRVEFLKLYKIVYGIVFVSLSSVFLFGGGTLFYRVLYMTMIPISILVIGLYNDGVINKRILKRLFAFNTMYMIIDYVYSIYASLGY